MAFGVSAVSRILHRIDAERVQRGYDRNDRSDNLPLMDLPIACTLTEAQLQDRRQVIMADHNGIAGWLCLHLSSHGRSSGAGGTACVYGAAVLPIPDFQDRSASCAGRDAAGSDGTEGGEEGD